MTKSKPHIVQKTRIENTRDSNGYLLKRRTLKRGKNGYWQYDGKYKKTDCVYFTCPHCAAIQHTEGAEIYAFANGTSMAGADGNWYQSLRCVKCERHLWVCFDGFQYHE